MAENYRVIGLMSGTSMDGLDLAYCEFSLKKGSWNFEVKYAETIPYDLIWLNKLNSARELSVVELKKLDLAYGEYLGQKTIRFLAQNKISSVDFIASHGHTIHHQPEKGITVQIGDGNVLQQTTGQNVVCDFRTQDVKLGGQGAPLVPIGDKLLFSKWDACLNLGGFSNISFDLHGERKAFDVSPANIVLNHLSRQLGLAYDKGGEMAKSGIVLESLLLELNKLPYYTDEIPKSLGIEWVESSIYPLIKNNEIIADLLCTVVEHVAIQIGLVINYYGLRNVLITGGGAFNTYLIERIKGNCTANVVISNRMITDYKEALVFAFLGVLKIRGEVNVLKSVTGAAKDHCSGVMFTNGD